MYIQYIYVCYHHSNHTYPRSLNMTIGRGTWFLLIKYFVSSSFYGSTKPKLAVACGAVRRVHGQPVYRSKDYEVCLTREGYSEQYRLLSRRVSNDEQPSAAALEHFKDHTQLKGRQKVTDLSIKDWYNITILVGGATYPLMVQGKPTSNTEHIITVLFVIPVGNEGIDRYQYVMECTKSLFLVL